MECANFNMNNLNSRNTFDKVLELQNWNFTFIYARKTSLIEITTKMKEKSIKLRKEYINLLKIYNSQMLFLKCQ